jgi:putative flippase GtrA
VKEAQQSERLEKATADEAPEAATPRLPLWKLTFWQFLRYCLVGSLNTLVDLAIFNALVWRFPTANAQMLLIYNSFAYVSGGVSSFFLNKYWTFGHKHQVTWREVRRFTLTLLAEVLYSNVLLWLAGKALRPFISNISLWSSASKLVAVGGGVLISYTFMRFWTFARGPTDHSKRV